MGDDLVFQILNVFKNPNRLKNLEKTERKILSEAINEAILIRYKEKTNNKESHYLLETIPLLQKELLRKDEEIEKYKIKLKEKVNEKEY